MATKMLLRIWIHVLSIVIGVILTGLLSQVQEKSLGVKFLWIISKFRKRKIISLLLVHVPVKCERKVHVRYFQVIVVQWWQWNVQKKVCSTCRVFVLPIQLTAFLTFLFSSSLWRLKLPNLLKWCYMEKLHEWFNWGFHLPLHHLMLELLFIWVAVTLC